MLLDVISGFGLGLSLILVIGAQNAFVLRQGLRGEHVFAVCLTCALSDTFLIAGGVAGIGALAMSVHWLADALRLFGAAFLVILGARSFRAAWLSDHRLEPGGGPERTLVATLATCLVLTWTNPHIYFETVLLIGSVAATHGAYAWAFGGGAILASVLFFFALGYGARILRPMFARPGAWRVLEVATGLIMWSIASSLLFDLHFHLR